MTPAPAGWLRAIIRPRFRGALLPHNVDNLGAEWNRSLGAWVLEPAPQWVMVDRETQQWGPKRNDVAHLAAQLALRDLGPEFTVEWQCDGASPVSGRREDVAPTVRTGRGWTTPKWEDPR